jgi:hypothetical protein
MKRIVRGCVESACVRPPWDSQARAAAARHAGMPQSPIKKRLNENYETAPIPIVRGSR